MRAVVYVYDGESADATVRAVLDALTDRPEETRVVDASEGESAVREASLAVRGAVRRGSTPDALHDERGALDFSAGALITEAGTGRRTLHVGEDALAALGNRGN